MRIAAPQNVNIPEASADFHMHTNTSDGILGARKVIDSIQNYNVTHAAFTDHDDMSTGRDSSVIRYLQSLGPDAPQMVPGVEITTDMGTSLREGARSTVHMVGLGLNPRHPKLRMAMIKQRLNRIDILHRVVDKLKAKGYDLRFGQLGAIAGLRSIQLYTVAALLVKNGYGTDTSKVKKELVNPIAKEVLREDPSLAYMKPEEAIKLIHDAGGVAILAHPQRNIPDYDPATLKTWLNDLSAAGLDGAEAFRADIPADKGELIEAISKDAGLLVSGGSDFHQFDWKGGGHHPGEAKMSVSVWPEIEKRIESRGGYTDFRDLPIPTSATPNAQERFLLGR